MNVTSPITCGQKVKKNKDDESNSQEVSMMAKIIRVDQRKPLEIKFADDPTSTQIAIRNA